MDANIFNILDQYKKGSSKDYDILVSNLNNPSIESELLIHYLRGLKTCISVVGKEYEVLVGVLLKLDWLEREPAVVHEYQSFLVNLVSAHTVYLRATLRALVKAFTPRPSSLSKNRAWKIVTDLVRKTDEEQFVKNHLVIKGISQIVPMMPTVLLPLLGDAFPYLSKAAYIQECYVKNLLQITHYMPDLRQRILELIVDRMLKIDVRCPRTEIEQAECADLPEDMDIFDMEKDDISTEMTHAKFGCEDMKHVDANKLDYMMELMLRYIENTCYKDGVLDWENTKLLYREILLIFERLIFPTHASCHVQFIMFYLCSLRPEICEGFLDFLWKKVTSPNVESIFRQGGVAYIASLISRGQFVHVSTLKACLELMSTWVHRYLLQANRLTRADVRHHGPFYSVCQAIFYVFAFRHKEILDSEKGYKWAKALNLQTLVTSRLNPLRFSIPVITKTFSSVTRSYQLAYCDTIVEKNNRLMLPECSLEQGTLTTDHLNAFFPFDPYLLLRSQHFISQIYREYEGNRPQEDVMESKDEDDFLPESTKSECRTSVEMSQFDFMNYGVSPGFKHV
ncbi:RNA polymerase I-specific transcription initiation factor RRN3-like [Liolophura sinensis]|uniref:RNA polymerase I-specific transcription initiation factor RRN3-like n=1 Tax=Liolophura sinensis TaxID=3198878 RepID=UPI0031592D92